MRTRALAVVFLTALAAPAAAPADGELLDQDRADVVAAPGVPGPQPQDQGRAVTHGSRGNEAFVVGWTDPGFSGGGVANSANWQHTQLTLTRFGNTGHDAGFRSAAPPGHTYRGVVANFPGEESVGQAVAFLRAPTTDGERILAGGQVAPNMTQAWDSLLLSYTRNGQLFPGFGQGGVVRTDPPGIPDSVVGAMQIQGDRLFFAGSGAQSGGFDRPDRGSIYVGRRDAFRGTADLGYGANGFWKMTPVFRDQAPAYTLVNDMAIDAARGRVFVCGMARYANGDIAGFVAAVRMQHQAGEGAGGLSSWNGASIRFINTPTDQETCNGVDVGPGGRVTAAVTQGRPDQVPDVIQVHQFGESGAYNAGFGQQGRVRIGQKDRSFGAEALVHRSGSLEPERLYIPGIDWGAIGVTGDRRMLLVGVRPNGELDEEFDGTQGGADGLVRTNVLAGQPDQAFDMAMNADILTLTGRASTELVVTRYRP
jgi:hypothetical protein